MKTCWSEIKHLVKAVNPEFYELVDAVNPSDDLGLTVLKFPYGYVVGDGKYASDELNQILPDDTAKTSLKMVLGGAGELCLETGTNCYSLENVHARNSFPYFFRS